MEYEVSVSLPNYLSGLSDISELTGRIIHLTCFTKTYCNSSCYSYSMVPTQYLSRQSPRLPGKNGRVFFDSTIVSRIVLILRPLYVDITQVERFFYNLGLDLGLHFYLVDVIRDVSCQLKPTVWGLSMCFSKKKFM